MRRHDYRPIDAFKLNLSIFTATGMWPAGVKNKSLRYLYAVYHVLSPGIWFGSFFALQVIQMVLVMKELQKVMDSMCLVVGYIGMLSKYTCFFLYRKRIEKLFEQLDDPIFTPRQLKHYDYIDEAMRIVRRDSIIFFSSGISATIFWTFYPLFDKHKNSKELAYVMWCPIDISKSPTFELVFAYQVIAITYNTMFNTMADTAICGLFRMMSGHLDVLAQDYNDLFDNAFICPGDINSKKMESDEEPVDHDGREEKISSDYNGKSILKNGRNKLSDGAEEPLYPATTISFEELRSRVAACIQYSQAIERFVNEVNYVFAGGILTQFIASCLIICATAFALTVVPVRSIQFMSLLQYLGCMVIQILIYCWRGNELTLKFAQIANSIYSCDWIACSSDFRRSLDIVMSRSHKPVILVVAGLFTLSVDTFIGIVKTAYSFFMFLKEVQARGN